MGIARSWGAVVAPVAALALPKCPLCLLPLLALAGVALPSAWELNWLIVIVTAVSVSTFDRGVTDEGRRAAGSSRPHCFSTARRTPTAIQ
jgi:hypothetical protein